MTEPGLGRRDQPARYLSPPHARQGPDDKRLVLRPWQGQTAGGKLVSARQVQEGRQQVALLHIAWSHKLWDMEELDRRGLSISDLLCVCIGYHAVRGAEINTNDITRR